MNAPLVVAAATAILTLAAVVLRGRATASAVLAGIGAGLIGVFALAANLDEPIAILGISLKFGSSWSILGRSLTLDEGNRAAVGFLYLAGAFILGGAWAARPERYLFILALIALGVVAGSLMVRPFLFAAIFLELAAMVCLLVLVSPSHPGRRGGVRLLTLYSLAMLTILLSGWMLETLGVVSGTPELALRTTVLLAVGFAILMAVPPFHHWLPAAAERAHPYAFAFVALILQSAGLFFLLRFLDGFEWLRDNPDLFSGMRWAGAAAVLFGSVWSLAQRSFSRLLAYAMVTDFGVSLVAVGSGTSGGYQLAIGLVGSHAVGLAVCALGLVILQGPAGADDVFELRGAAGRAPLGAAAALVGLLSVAGFPLTAGFPGRWALLAILAEGDVSAAVAVLLGVLFVGGAAARWLGVLLRGSESVDRRTPSFAVRVFLVGGIGMCILFGAFPQLFASVFLAARGLTNLVP